MFAELLALAEFTQVLHMAVDRACRGWLDGRKAPLRRIIEFAALLCLADRLEPVVPDAAH